MRKGKYELTEEDIADINAHKSAVIKNLIWLFVFWSLDYFKKEIFWVLDEIRDLLLNSGGTVIDIYVFIRSILELVPTLAGLLALIFAVITVISVFKLLIRNRKHYENKAKKQDKDNVKWFKKNTALVNEFRTFVEKVKVKTKRCGVDIFAHDLGPEDFEEKSCLDATHWDKTGEAFYVYITRFKGYIIISHLAPTVLRFMDVSLFLTVDCEEEGYSAGFVDNAKFFKSSMRYIHDRRRDGGFFVIVPRANISITGFGDGSKARISYRSELGVEHIDVCTSSGADYDDFAYLLRK